MVAAWVGSWAGPPVKPRASRRPASSRRKPRKQPTPLQASGKPGEAAAGGQTDDRRMRIPPLFPLTSRACPPGAVPSFHSNLATRMTRFSSGITATRRGMRLSRLRSTDQDSPTRMAERFCDPIQRVKSTTKPGDWVQIAPRDPWPPGHRFAASLYPFYWPSHGEPKPKRKTGWLVAAAVTDTRLLQMRTR